MAAKGRFAPTPSGRMHLGNLFTALLAWLSVRAQGGTMVLRIEDLDTSRCKNGYAAQLAEDLRLFGLHWDEGYGVGGSEEPYSQSLRTAQYERAFQSLAAQGLVYPCYCSRAERMAASAPHRGDGQTPYSGRCRTLSETQRAALGQGRPCAWRVAVPARALSFTDLHRGDYTQQLAQTCGDFIVRRSDGVYAYQLAVVVDDAAMGINQVVRGADLLDSTPRQLWLYERLGLTPPAFYHTPLLLAPDGRRLSKRERDLDLGALLLRYTPAELLGILAVMAGQQMRPEPTTAAQLAARFSWARVPKEDIILDCARLENHLA